MKVIYTHLDVHVHVLFISRGPRGWKEIKKEKKDRKRTITKDEQKLEV